MAAANPIYLGVKGSVIALNSRDGSKLWITPLKGSYFVNVALGKDAIYATTRGEIFCLDPKSGEIRWTNPLTGFGFGLVSIAGKDLVQNDFAVTAQKHTEEEQARQASAS